MKLGSRGLRWFADEIQAIHIDDRAQHGIEQLDVPLILTANLAPFACFIILWRAPFSRASPI